MCALCDYMRIQYLIFIKCELQLGNIPNQSFRAFCNIWQNPPLLFCRRYKVAENLSCVNTKVRDVTSLPSASGGFNAKI
jgi:hypothetical protein